MRTRYKIVVCFSASNLALVCEKYPDCIVVADHDKVGVGVAKKSGRPFFVPPNLKEDFNDYEMRVGAMRAGKSLTGFGLLEAAL
jgi:hypothetical protein